MKTYTPELEPAVLDRLANYTHRFAADFSHPKQLAWGGVYLNGLLLDGDRKSIEPLSHRVVLPEGLSRSDPEQALQQFINQSPWDERRVLSHYRAHLAETFASPKGIFVIDDVSFPKKGEHSVGVQRQYCGALGKKANCQVAVSVHYVSPRGHYPLDMRLYLPECWLKNPEQLDRVGVPDAERRSSTKPEIALELLDRVRREGLPAQAVIADAGYGMSGAFREGLTQRGLSYIVGVTEDFVVFPQQPQWEEPPQCERGRPAMRSRLAEGNPPPVALRDLVKTLRLRKVTWREGTKGKMAARFVWVRVWPGSGWKTGIGADAEPIWLMIEEQGENLKFAFSNLPAETGIRDAVRLWKSRWAVEQGYQQMKEELGVDHFEGRSWRGFHHHCCMVMLAFGFLLLERHRIQEHPFTAKKKRVNRV